MTYKAIRLLILIPMAIVAWLPFEVKADKNVDMLREFLWNNRLLLVFAPRSSDNNFLQQRKMVKSNEAGFIDRDMVVIEIVGGRVFAREYPLKFRYLASSYRANFGVSEREFRTFLVGKDGHIKYKSSLASDPCHLFDLIDSMPMRRREITKDSGINTCIN